MYLYFSLHLQKCHILLRDCIYDCCVNKETNSYMSLGNFKRLIYVIKELSVFFETGFEIFNLILFLKLAEAPLQVRFSRVRFPIGSLRFFSALIVLTALWP
jgi:hypothetical protein